MARAHGARRSTQFPARRTHAERQVQLYDTTLRDGMQREGLSRLGRREGAHRAQARRARHRLHRGRLPGSNPKETSSSAHARRAPGERASSSAFGMTRRKGVARRGRRQPARAGRASGRPSSRIVGKTWDLTSEGAARRPRREPAHDRRVGALSRGAGQARGLRRRALLRRLRARPGLRARLLRRGRRGGRRRWSPSATPTGPSCRVVADVVARGRGGAAGAPRRHPRAQRRAAAPSPTRWWRSTPGRGQVQGTINGYGERCGNANLCTHHPGPQAQDGPRLRAATSSSSASPKRRTSSPRWSTLALTRTSPTWAAPRSRTKAACTSRPCEQAPETFEHVDPELVGNAQRIVVSRAVGQGRHACAGPGAGLLEGDDERVAIVLKRLKEREHEGYQYEAADASFELLLRASWRRTSRFPPRELPHHRREARGRQRRGGHHQGPRRRRAHHQHGGGQRPGERAGQGAAPAIERKFPHVADIHLVNYKVRILDETKGTGAVTRVLLDSSDGGDSWGSVGVGENVVEAAGRPWWTQSSSACCAGRKGRAPGPRHQGEVR